jgi:hypothetical protein
MRHSCNAAFTHELLDAAPLLRTQWYYASLPFYWVWYTAVSQTHTQVDAKIADAVAVGSPRKEPSTNASTYSAEPTSGT